jgi:hypothetical protein
MYKAQDNSCEPECRPAIACGPPTCPSCEQWSYYWNQCVGVNCGGGSCVWCAGGSCQLCGGNPEKCCPDIPGWACVDKCGGSGGPCCAAEGKFCCTGGSGSACCNPGVQGCCDGQCYDKDTQECCGGQVYNKATHKCCEEGSNKWVCEIDKECCNGSCCPEGQCCVNGECKDPICDNCHSISDTAYECGHYESSTTCASDFCIIEVLDTATCDYHPNSTCPSKCNVEAVVGQPAVLQRKVNLNSPICMTGGQPVQYHVWHQIYYGCGTCSAEPPWRTACETFGCPGEVEYSVPRGAKTACAGTCP